MVSFEEQKSTLRTPRKTCFVTMTSGGEPAWRFHYFYGDGVCKVDDFFALREVPKRTAAKELDFLMYCFEKHATAQRIRAPGVLTNKAFARFLYARGWSVARKNKSAYEVEKDLVKDKVPAPSVMGGNWRKKRLAARRAIR